MSAEVIARLRGSVIDSCQPAPGGSLDSPMFVVGFALAARDGGARGLRIQGERNVAAVIEACDLPVIGLIKRDLPDSPVRITALLEDVDALAGAGAPIVALDATARPRPVAVPALIAAVHACGRLAMADCANLAEMRAALAAGADIVASTMSGYSGGAVPALPDLDLVRAGAVLGAPLFAEGRYNTPALAAAAIEAGAHAVVVGTAITRPEAITAWYAAAIAGARKSETGDCS